MIIPKLNKLAALRKKVARLELVIETELYEELFAIHQRYGFADLESFVEAVKLAARGGGRKAGRPKNADPSTKRRKRAKITDATRAKVAKLAKEGLSGSKIAKAVGISLPSVHNIKKALGLVKARKVKVKRVVAAKKTSAKKAPSKRSSPKKRPAKKRPVGKALANKTPVAPIEQRPPQLA